MWHKPGCNSRFGPGEAVSFEPPEAPTVRADGDPSRRRRCAQLSIGEPVEPASAHSYGGALERVAEDV
jgi:hypothetical protein